ncbi:MAG: hypothetical protein ACKOKE_04960 [Actinomycetota bacterium]
MRRPHVVGTLLLALLASGCGTVSPATQGTPPISVRNLPSPFQRIAAGDVRTVIPDGWTVSSAGDGADPRVGVLAAPARDGLEGMAALWIDAARVGVASDYYYVVATRAVASLLPAGATCSVGRERIHVDHAPDALTGVASPGDFIADTSGRCTGEEVRLRWRAFVVAPGFGAARAIGIPNSGLYVVVAVLRDRPRVEAMLRRILTGTAFGGATMPDFVAAAVA